MDFETTTVLGPRVAQVDKQTALRQLQDHPQYVSGSKIVDIEDKDGHWVATVDIPKTAGPFPPKPDDEAPDEAAPEGPPKSDGPPDDSESEEKPEGPPFGKDDSESGGEGEKKPKKPSVEEAVLHLTDLVTQIAQAVGVGGPGGPGGMMGGPDAGGPPLPPDGPPGAGGPPGGPQVIEHHKALKPGEAGPGQIPVGAPAFSSTHPWASLLGKTAHFTVTSDPTTQTIAEAYDELDALSIGTGYVTAQAKPFTDEDGNRRIKALIVAESRAPQASER